MDEKPVIKVDMPEVASKFLNWYMPKHYWYGDLFDEWWKKRGVHLFHKYAKRHSALYMKDSPEVDKEFLRKLYESCVGGHSHGAR